MPFVRRSRRPLGVRRSRDYNWFQYANNGILQVGSVANNVQTDIALTPSNLNVTFGGIFDGDWTVLRVRGVIGARQSAGGTVDTPRGYGLSIVSAKAFSTGGIQPVFNDAGIGPSSAAAPRGDFLAWGAGIYGTTLNDNGQNLAYDMVVDSKGRRRAHGGDDVLVLSIAQMTSPGPQSLVWSVVLNVLIMLP